MAFINLRPHVIQELNQYGLDAYFLLGGTLGATYLGARLLRRNYMKR